jgi:hypothetical protein
VPTYEHEAVAGNDYTFGGWRNTGVPNAVYRWTEREVAKVLASYDPAHAVPVSFFYGLRLPTGRIAQIRNPLKRLLFRLSVVPFRLIAALLPRQMNEFAFFIDKDARERHVWIDPVTGNLSRSFWTTGTWKEPELAARGNNS